MKTRIRQMVARGTSLAAAALIAFSTPGQAQESGADIWRQGGCFACHGNLAAGDGDPAYPAGPNLRRTGLDGEQLFEVIACGRPQSGMPAHLAGAYTEIACFEAPLGPVPGDIILTGQFTQEQVDLLVDFLMQNVVGVTRITRENCATFFGGNMNAPACLQY